MALMKFVISWWKCLPYNKLERLSCTEMTHRSLSLCSSVKSAAIPYVFCYPKSPLQKTKTGFWGIGQEKGWYQIYSLDAGMQRKKASRSLLATGCHAVSLMGSAQGKPSYCSPCMTSLHPPSPYFVDCGTLPQWQRDNVSCPSVWSCATKVRQEQWERPPAPAQPANRSKLSNSAWKPLCCLWMKADLGVARGRLWQVEPMSCTHTPIILLTPGWEHSCTLMIDVCFLLYLMPCTHGRR